MRLSADMTFHDLLDALITEKITIKQLYLKSEYFASYRPVLRDEIISLWNELYQLRNKHGQPVSI
jgi:hypothetical protein